MKIALRVAVAGMTCALSFAILFFSGFASFFSYLMPVFAGMLLIVLCRSVSKGTAFLVYFVTSVLTLFLSTDKECSLLYASFFGYYPIIKSALEKINSKFFVFFSKFIVFNVSITVAECLLVYVFKIPFEEFFGVFGIVLLYLLANIFFLVYDKLIDIATLLYNKKWKIRFERLIK